MIDFLKKVIFLPLYIFTSAIILLTVFLNYFLPQFVYENIEWLILFFFLLTLISYLTITDLYNKNPKSFIMVYFTTMIIRLFISILFASVFIILDRQNIMPFSYNFLILYLLFLGFEIYAIMTNLRLQNKKGINKWLKNCFF